MTSVDASDAHLLAFDSFDGVATVTPARFLNLRPV
jgi:hypothetical protein